MDGLYKGIMTAVILFALWLCGWLVYDGISITNENKKYIGSEIVLYNDTLTIIDYNTSLGYHILENGLIVDKEYVKAKAFQKTPNKTQIDTNTIKAFREMGYLIKKIDTTKYGLNP